MKSPFGLRLWILIAALFLVAGGTIYGLSFAWHRVQQVEAKLTSSQIERFQLASEVRRELQSLNNSMLRYALVRDPQQWAQFEQASSDLDHWIDDHDPSLNPHSPLTTEAERQIFKELNHAYDDYLAAARAVHSNAQPALVTSGATRATRRLRCPGRANARSGAAIDRRPSRSGGGVSCQRHRFARQSQGHPHGECRDAAGPGCGDGLGDLP